MNKNLKDYTEGITFYTPIINILMRERSKDWFNELGRYIVKTIDISKIPSLSFFVNRMKSQNSIITKIKNFDQEYDSIGIFFITETLDEKSLEKMFGKPLLHDKFGEGFKGKYNDETDEYDESEIKESYASYFINIDEVEFHIGYDHRGTNIEILMPSKFQHEVSKEDSLRCFNALKSIVNLYKTKNPQ